ncbi:MAG: CRISPR-associated endoribonuclease Cas6 [Cyclobacteriaceae bacterium]
MRVRITLKVNNRGGLVPFHHQFLVAQLLKGLIIEGKNQEFINYTFYSFSGLKGQTRVSRNGLQYTSSLVTLVVASVNIDFLKYIVDLIFSQNQIKIGELSLTPDTTDEEVMMNLDEKVKYVCISPIVPLQPTFNSEEGKRFIEPESNEFSDALFDYTVTRMESFGIKTSSIASLEKFQVIPDKSYIDRIRTTNKKFSRIYSVFDQDVQYEVRGYTFPFTLFAAPEVQDFLFTCGLGLYGNKGHGMLDVANADPLERTVSLNDRSLISA